MGRRVAIVGAVLAVVGVLIEMVSFRYLVMTEPSDQLARLVTYVVALLPVLGTVCTTAGAVMIGVGAFNMLTDYLLVRTVRPAVLWSGIGLVVLATVVEIVTLSGPVVWAASPEMREGLLVPLVHLAGLARLVGAVFIGLWLTGLVSGERQRAVASPSGPPLAPSRPF